MNKDINEYKELNSLSVLMQSVKTPEFTGEIIATLIIYTADKFSFLGVIIEKSQGKDKYQIAKLDLIEHKIEGLTPNEASILLEQIKLHNTRFPRNYSFDKYINDSFIDYVKHYKVNKESSNLINYEKLSILLQDKALDSIIEDIHIQIANTNISIISASIYNSVVFNSEIIEIDKNSIHTLIDSYSLYNDINLYWTMSGSNYAEKGVIVKSENHNLNLALYIQPYPMELLQNASMNKAIFKDMRNPFTMMRYVLESDDFDIKGINIQNEVLADNMYLVVTAVKNFKLLCNPITIGDVRIGEKVEISQEYRDSIERECTSEYELIWTTANGFTHYEAVKNAQKKFESIIDIIAFLLKNDILKSNFGITKTLQEWDIRNNTPKILLTNYIYVENCFSRETIIVMGEQTKSPITRNLTDTEADVFEEDFIDLGYEKFLNNNKQMYRLFYSINWVNRSWNSENKFDKIIYSIMALEFCLSGEKGNSIIEDFLLTNKCDNNEGIVKKILADMLSNINIQLDGVADDINDKLNVTVKNEIKKSLCQGSFMSQLLQLIKRLSIPIKDNEIDIIKKARNVRNSMIHGREMNTMTSLEIKKLSGIISRILIYKFKEIAEGD